MSTEDLMVEARAKIIWGDEPQSVRFFLTSNGMSVAEADAKVSDLVVERNAQIRKLGIKGTCVGGTIVCVSASFIYYSVKHPDTLFPSTQGKAMYFAALIGLYGLWKLVNGMIRLVRPKSERGSMADMSG